MSSSDAGYDSIGLDSDEIEAVLARPENSVRRRPHRVSESPSPPPRPSGSTLRGRIQRNTHLPLSPLSGLPFNATHGSSDTEEADASHKKRRIDVSPPQTDSDRSVLELEHLPSTQVTASKEVISRLEEELMCPICQEILIEPYITVPCGHTACGWCLDRSLRRAYTCFTCREKLASPEAAIPNFAIKSVVAAVQPLLTEEQRDDYAQRSDERKGPFNFKFRQMNQVVDLTGDGDVFDDNSDSDWEYEDEEEAQRLLRGLLLPGRRVASESSISESEDDSDDSTYEEELEFSRSGHRQRRATPPPAAQPLQRVVPPAPINSPPQGALRISPRSPGRFRPAPSPGVGIRPRMQLQEAFNNLTDRPARVNGAAQMRHRSISPVPRPLASPALVMIHQEYGEAGARAASEDHPARLRRVVAPPRNHGRRRQSEVIDLTLDSP